MSAKTYKATCFSQNGRRIFQTNMTVSDLLEISRIERYDPNLPYDHPDQGYQRALEDPRARKLGKWADNEGSDLIIPGSILLSSRGTSIRYDEASLVLSIPRGDQLILMDGQTREAGMEYAISKLKNEQLRGFQLSITIIEGLSKIEEMKIFAKVNGEQKGVRTDLVSMILTKIQAETGDVPERDLWRVVASRVIEKLNADDDGPWFDLIVMPNESRYSKAQIKDDSSLAHKKITRATSFLSSLKPIYDYLKEFDLMGTNEDAQVDEISRMISAFWEALRELNPEPFDRPGDFVLQKTPGLFSLHRILRRLLPIMHSARLTWDDPEEFARQLEVIPDLQDPNYWDSKAKMASVYGSQKGFSELAGHLWDSRSI